MSRRRRAEPRQVLPDPVYNSTLVERFVNSMMWDGKKAVSQRIFYGAMDQVRERAGDDPLKLVDRKSTRLNSSHVASSRMPSSA